MDGALTLIGIEAPRSPQLRRAKDHRSVGEWEVAGVRLLERAVKALRPLASEGGLALICGEPDQAVFDLVRKYNVIESDLMTWMQGVSSQARSAKRSDVALFIRSDVVLRDYAVVAKAIEAIRLLDQVDRVELAYRPKRQPLERALTLVRGDRGELMEQGLELPAGEIGQVCPAFEAHRLMNFTPGSLEVPNLTGSAFLWIDEDDFAVLESPLDFLRAEAMLDG